MRRYDVWPVDVDGGNSRRLTVSRFTRSAGVIAVLSAQRWTRWMLTGVLGSWPTDPHVKLRRGPRLRFDPSRLAKLGERRGCRLEQALGADFDRVHHTSMVNKGDDAGLRSHRGQ